MHSGGDITRESAGAEVHATCACLVESPHRKGEIWASTDDGLVHVTRDDGASWQNVTPPDMPALAYVGCVEISAHDADTVYVAATRYKLADYQPYLFRSSDSGRSWQSISGSFPAGEITRVLRADPVRPGLLFVGTETGIYVTLDDGQSWMRMQGGLPVVPVYDLKIKDTDLVAGTHGRSFWILDDITPLRALADGSAETRLFPPRATIRTKLHFGSLVGVRAPHLLRHHLRHRRRHRHHGAARWHQGAGAPRRRREPAERRDRLLLAGRQCIRPGRPHLPRCGGYDDRHAAQRRRYAAGGAPPGTRPRPQPLRVGHEVSGTGAHRPVTGPASGTSRWPASRILGRARRWYPASTAWS